jgi:hypothetical protein
LSGDLLGCYPHQFSIHKLLLCTRGVDTLIAMTLNNYSMDDVAYELLENRSIIMLKVGIFNLRTNATLSS